MTLLDLRRPNILAWAEETFENAYNSKVFSDVTLITEDNQYIEAHKLVLCSSSPFFESIFTKQTGHNLSIYLHGISHRTIKSVLEFISLSKTKVIASELERFMEVSRQFQIKGISEKVLTELQTIDTGIADYQLFKEEQTNNIDEFQTTNSKDDTFIIETETEKESNNSTTFGNKEFDGTLLDRCKETQSRKNETNEIKQITNFEQEHKLTDLGYASSQETSIVVQKMNEDHNKKQITTTENSPYEKNTQINNLDVGQITCTFCGYKNKSNTESMRKKNLRNHMNAKHSAVTFPCLQPKCGRICTTKENLKAHMKSCHDCQYCDYISDSNPNLKNHKRIKHGIQI